MEPRNFKTYEPDQLMLLPPSMKEWLPEGHLAYFIMDVVKPLDLEEVMRAYPPARGTVPFHPRMMTGVLLYAYCVGTPSSRKIAKKLEEDIGFRIVGANQRPDFRTISEFRRIHLKALKKLFVQVLKWCQKAKMVKATGQNIINPVAAISAAQIMLSTLGEDEAASRIDAAVAKALRENIKDLGAGKMGYTTKEVGDLIADYVGSV